MTDQDPGTGAETPEAALVELGPVPVTTQAADYGSYGTLTFTGTEAAALLLPFDEHRYRAVLTCTGTGPVYIGTQAQAQQKLGYTLTSGTQLEIRHRQAVWIAPDGTHSATVAYTIERWGA